MSALYLLLSSSQDSGTHARHARRQQQRQVQIKPQSLSLVAWPLGLLFRRIAQLRKTSTTTLFLVVVVAVRCAAVD
jgi:hypothetical protein